MVLNFVKKRKHKLTTTRARLRRFSNWVGLRLCSLLFLVHEKNLIFIFNACLFHSLKFFNMFFVYLSNPLFCTTSPCQLLCDRVFFHLPPTSQVFFFHGLIRYQTIKNRPRRFCLNRLPSFSINRAFHSIHKLHQNS